MQTASQRLLLKWAGLHYLAYIAMQTMALFAETRRGPTLPDLLLDRIPVDRSYDWVNSQFWLPALLVSLLLLAIYRPVLCINYLKIGAAVSVMRGIFIVLTSLGPPAGVAEHTSEAMLSLTLADFSPSFLMRQWFPVDAFWGGSGLSAVYLTQDLFFSGHTATTFLLVLITRKERRFFVPFLFFHVITVAFLFVTHEHYSIDVFGAYFVVYALYHFFKERRWIDDEHYPA
ncbi:MAG: hypothetical protein F9K24_04525 [Leptonema illini]|uniref:Sphingomyelin synthase-like domain-containing protein n=1 Tax=Leptonema illini TaxID=183 RepID=A0A833LZK6_9LEPT|nr:MAG: hypothetical protein F9K24_04525 [Leptonema illini]